MGDPLDTIMKMAVKQTLQTSNANVQNVLKKNER